MLSYLKIENIAIIEKAEIEFSKGFNVLSGETGAGKSIILDSIGAVIGFRTSREVIRTGETEAFVSALFSNIGDSVKEKLSALGLKSEEDGSLLLSRVIGLYKNICKVNDTVVTVSTLREIGSVLINIHGQQDSRDLLDSTKHLFYIDKVANNDELLLEMEKRYLKYTKTQKERETLTISNEKKERLTDMLQYEINELSLANIKIG
ncbi:MAG TPA: AAA family ATPase, partial [Oscillospiraceae bacterium]|nr:AAA family ATPase [Oscillospiraceae bacterium]